jgi:hypothetical protein
VKEPVVRAYNKAIEGKDTKNIWEVMDIAKEIAPAIKDYQPARQILHAKHVYGNGWFIPQSLDFSMHVVRRALSVGIEKALLELEQYISDTHVGLQQVVVLVDTDADTAHTFCNGISFISCKDVIPSTLAEQLDQHQLGLISNHRVYGVLARDYRVEKRMLPLEADLELVCSDFRDDDDFTWTRLAMALISHGGAPELFREVAVPHKYGFLKQKFCRYLRMDLGSPIPTQLTNDDLAAIDEVLKLIGGFVTDDRSRLFILMDQFYRARLNINQVQKAIHLRICIENMFIDDGEKDEIASKVKNRGAPYLGQSKTATNAIYDMLSRAVHRGEFLSSSRFSAREIERFVQDAIQKILANGAYPSWRA